MDRISKQYIFDNKHKMFEDFNEGMNPREVRVYTDRSETDSGKYWGIFRRTQYQNFKPLGNHNTVIQAENVSIKATEAITARRVKNDSILILSGSIYLFI